MRRILILPVLLLAAAAASGDEAGDRAAVLYAGKGNIHLAVTYSGYAFANCGLLALDLKG